MAERPMEHFTVDGVNIFEVTDAKARQDCSDLKEDFHSYHSELGAGYADQIVSGIVNEDSVPYNFRKVPYDATLEKVEGIVGCDVVVNQLVEDGFSITGNASKVLQNGASVVSNHIYFYGLKRDVNTEKVQSDLYTRVNGNLTPIFSIFMQTGGSLLASTIVKSNYSGVSDGTQGNGSLWFYVGSTTTVTTTSEYMLIDLTQTFGTAIADYVYGLETTTAGSGVAWLKANAPKIFNGGYIPYNPGELVSVAGVSEKRNTGFNQWDEEYVNGFFNDSGVYTARADIVGSKNAIHVLPNTTYCFNGKASAFVTYWRSKVSIDNAPTGEFISRKQMNADVSTFTTPADCHYIFFNMPVAYGTTYKNDICINLHWDGEKDGTYEPYTVHTYAFDPTVELRGVPKLKDGKMYFDGDRYLPDGTVQRRYGVVDLGTLEWHAISGYAGYFKAVTTEAVNIDNEVVANALCPKYVTVKGNDLASKDKVIAVGMNNAYEIQIGDSAYSTASASDFRNALAGVMLLYKKRLFTTETAEPYQQRQIIDADGTEEFVSTSVVPVGHITKYPENLRKKVEGLPWNFATLIAPTEATFKATRNYTTGSLFIVNNVLYKATANIANGGTITPNTNCTATTLAEVISALS